MRKTYFSNRVYKDQLLKSVVPLIEHTLFVFNRAKHAAFQTQVREKRSGLVFRTKSIHLTVKERFQLNDYYANSAVQEANALLRSQEELRSLYIENKQIQIQSVKKKIKSTKQRLTVLRKIKQSFIQGKPAFNKTSPEQQYGRFFAVQRKRVTPA